MIPPDLLLFLCLTSAQEVIRSIYLSASSPLDVLIGVSPVPPNEAYLLGGKPMGSASGLCSHAAMS